MCAETLEHLYDPSLYLARLCGMADRVLLTVPHEPYFRLCNLAQGRDVRQLGNHPEHVQHWSARSFRRYVSQYVAVERFETSFPFLLVMGTTR